MFGNYFIDCIHPKTIRIVQFKPLQFVNLRVGDSKELIKRLSSNTTSNIRNENKNLIFKEVPK